MAVLNPAENFPEMNRTGGQSWLWLPLFLVLIILSVTVCSWAGTLLLRPDAVSASSGSLVKANYGPWERGQSIAVDFEQVATSAAVDREEMEMRARGEEPPPATTAAPIIMPTSAGANLIPPTAAPTSAPTGVPTATILPTKAPTVAKPPTKVPPTAVPPTPVPATPIPATSAPPPPPPPATNDPGNVQGGGNGQGNNGNGNGNGGPRP